MSERVFHSAQWYEPEDELEPVGEKEVFIVTFLGSEDARFDTLAEAQEYLQGVEDGVEDWNITPEWEYIYPDPDDGWAKDWDD